MAGPGRGAATWVMHWEWAAPGSQPGGGAGDSTRRYAGAQPVKLQL